MTTEEQVVRDGIATATRLTLNGQLPPALLDKITADGLAAAEEEHAAQGLEFASKTVLSRTEAHWFQIVHHEPIGERFEFRTYFLQPSLGIKKVLRVRMYAVQNDQLVDGPGYGGSSGSSVAHGTLIDENGEAVGTPNLSNMVFPASGESITYYFRIKLVGNGTPPSGPYVFLALKK
jgi:hypothetical protein